jgi:IPT/TIG domain/WD40-like Beta Propeller Repeat
MHSRRWLIAALAALAVADGCSQFNTNLTTQTSSSSLRFLSPAQVNAGGQGFTLTVTGLGFVSGAIVLWNGTPLTTTFVSTTTLTADIPASNIASPGNVPVAISIPGSAVSGTSGTSATGTTALSNVVIFTINPSPPPAPAIISLQPPSIGAGSSSFTLTVNGTNFATGTNPSVILWNGIQMSTTVTTATLASTIIPASFVVTQGSVPVTISNAASGGGPSNPLTFTITTAPPTISAAAAAAGQVSSPGVSADRRYVVFAMASTDGYVEAPGTAQNVFVRDTCAGAPAGCTPATSLVSVATDGLAGNGDSTLPSISGNGRYVAFVSWATNLADGDTNGVSDVFVRDTCVGAVPGCVPTTQRVSVATGGAQANGPSTSASISATGRYVTFRSEASNLDPAVSPSAGAHSYVRDTCIGAADSENCTPSTQRLNLQN